VGTSSLKVYSQSDALFFWFGFIKHMRLCFRYSLAIAPVGASVNVDIPVSKYNH